MSYKERKYRKWLNDVKSCDHDLNRYIEKGIITKISDDKWTKRYVEKANHNMDFASLVTEFHKTIINERFPEQTFFDWVIIAYYYSIYHAALALLANIGLKSKSHLATLCGVIYYYYHKKSLGRKHIEILGKINREELEEFLKSQDLRQRASYGVSVRFEERLALIARNDAINFVNKTKGLLKNAL